uniref:(northern house mosquito) hypothetical protein n=1 Tax=Culex pipiens TaxID=7175 RepID=A0A8D8CMD6_CULPI
MAQVPARNPKYSAADLWPPGSKDRDFPPAAFFPVYVGNFLCQQRAELVARVQQYFASKGLLARMVFVRSAQNDPFQSYQDKTKLYDCLVYLTRQRDAQDAVKYLHRDKYYGHRLNVFPGRVPQFFDPAKSVQYTIRKHSGSVTEQVLENELVQSSGGSTTVVVCTVKHSQQEAFVEFSDPASMERAIQRGSGLCSVRPGHMDSNQPRQRFLEQHVQSEMMFHITANPRFMFLMPEGAILEALYKGIRPPVWEEWKVDQIDTTRDLRGRKQEKRVKRLARKAIRKVEKKAAKRGLSVRRWRDRFPEVDEEYLEAASGEPILYVRSSGRRESSKYDDLYNLGLEYIAKKWRSKLQR